MRKPRPLLPLFALLLFAGLAITGAPPFAVFLSEFRILKAGLMRGHYIITGLLAIFIVVAFFGVMLHVNRMVFGKPPVSDASTQTGAAEQDADTERLPFSCGLILALAAIPVLVLGVYIPKPLHELMALAARALTR